MAAPAARARVERERVVWRRGCVSVCRAVACPCVWGFANVSMRCKLDLYMDTRTRALTLSFPHTSLRSWSFAHATLLRRQAGPAERCDLHKTTLSIDDTLSMSARRAPGRHSAPHGPPSRPLGRCAP